MTEPTTNEVPAAGAIIARKLATLAKITQDPSIQVRGIVDQNRVKEYEAYIREHGFMDPITLFTEGMDVKTPVFWVADGFHRIEAYTAAGLDKFPAEIRLGSKSDAIWFSMGKNGHHGATMTNAQKRHCAELAVVDPEIGNKTDKEIASKIGCSASLVSEARRGLTVEVKRKKREAESPSPKSSGKRESESPAPRAATARERKAEDKQPTKAMVLRQIQDYLTSEVIDEQDLIKLMEGKDGGWVWLPKPGAKLNLKVVGTNGRVQVEGETIVKEVAFTGVILKNEGAKLLRSEQEA